MKIVRHKEKLKGREYDVNRSLLANETVQLRRMKKHGSNRYLPLILQEYTNDGVWSYFVMEYFEKGSVHAFIEKNGSLNHACIFGIGLRLIKCLEQMHQVGVGWLHLDVKPENVMIRRFRTGNLPHRLWIDCTDSIC